MKEAKRICRWYDVCPLKIYFEQGKLSKKWIEDYCWGNYNRCVRKKMEEGGELHPDNMLPDGSIDKRLK